MKRSRITSYLAMISLGLVFILLPLLYFLEPDSIDFSLGFILPGLLAGFLIFPSIVCSYFELQVSKHNLRFYSPPERQSIGRVLSLIYGISFLILGIVMVSVLSVISELEYLIIVELSYCSWIIIGILGIVGAILYRDTSGTLSSDEIIKRRKIGFSVVMIYCILFVTMILIFNANVPYYRTRNVKQDAYVYEYHPNTNYGQESQIFVGNYEFGKTEAFYQFDLSGHSDELKEVNLAVRFDFASYPVNVGACIIFDNWDETSITWNNKPNKTALYGHILCDGFDFNVPIKPKYFINNQITICLYGIGGGSDGYLLGNSKESNDDNLPLVYLDYKGIDPNFYIGYIIAYLVIFAVLGLYLKYAGKFSNPYPRSRTPIPNELLRRYQLNEGFRRRTPPPPIARPWRENRLQFTDFYKPKEIFKINELVDLRLIGNRTYIYVNNRRLMVCTFLLINIPSDNIRASDDIKSIDEAAEFLDRSLEGASPYHYIYRITPEEEFRAHCSNIQAFFENGLNTNILHTNVAFPLLKELVRQGYEPAKKVFKEEIAIRFNEGTNNSRRFLYLGGYLNYLSEEEKQSLEGYDHFIKNLPYGTSPPRELFLRERLLRERQAILRGLRERENAMRYFQKIVVFGAPGVGKNTLSQKFLTNLGRNMRSTIGLNFSTKNVLVNNQRFELRIWNIMGGAEFRPVRPLFLRGAVGGIFIYDITRKSSLDQIDDWLSAVEPGIREINRFPIIVVGNKSDLSDKRKVPVDEAIKFAKSRGVNGYIECSFQTGKNVEKIFRRLVKLILKNQEENILF
ncbi:MAG: GTP-binding protein [Promethearchaeota archaeon]